MGAAAVGGGGFSFSSSSSSSSSSGSGPGCGGGARSGHCPISAFSKATGREKSTGLAGKKKGLVNDTQRWAWCN